MQNLDPDWDETTNDTRTEAAPDQGDPSAEVGVPPAADTCRELLGFLPKLPRYCGNPIQTFIENYEQLLWFIQVNNGSKDVFQSHNIYPEQGTLINTFVPQDFDSKDKPENALLDALNVRREMKKLDIPTAIFWSGGKGCHLYSVFKPQLYQDDNTLKQAYAAFQNMQVQVAKTRTHDKHIIGDTRRLLRIPNTIHPKTVANEKNPNSITRYCVQIPDDMLERASVPEILEWATKPRPVALPEPHETFSECFKRLNLQRPHIVRSDSGEPEPTVPYHYDLVPELVRALIPRPCIHQALLSHNPPHVVRFEAASSIARKGFPYSVYSGVMHDIAAMASWVDRHNRDKMEYQLKHIFIRGYDRETSCQKLRSLGLCVGQSCERFTREFPNEPTESSNTS